MEITVSQSQGQVPVTILEPHGALDASSYRQLIARAKEAYTAGTRDMLIDMSGLTHMSSSGIVALHTISMLMRGEELPEEESGWEAARRIDRDSGGGLQKHFKLLNPPTNIDKILDMVGFKNFVEVHTDLKQAVASF